MLKGLQINPKVETEKIVHFLQKTFRSQKMQKAVIGISGGIDSATSLLLLKQAIGQEQIFPVYLPYQQGQTAYIKQLLKQVLIPKTNYIVISIKPIVDEIIDTLRLEDNLRIGNVMARVRMILLFDLAKKYDALVCGTENKSEKQLGYFTRFGDGASDIEPTQHLYKTQIYQLANYIHVPSEIINLKPTAGLWPGQTDEGEFGFPYKEADEVLYLHFQKKLNDKQIEKLGYKKTEKIFERIKRNEFKQKTPYTMKKELT